MCSSSLCPLERAQDWAAGRHQRDRSTRRRPVTLYPLMPQIQVNRRSADKTSR
jgi:hypothetical protein